MKTFLEEPYRRFPTQVDRLLSIMLKPCAYLMLTYRRFGSVRLPQTTGMLRAMGVFPIMNYYTEPLFHPDELRKPLREDRFLPGINFNDDAQVALLKQMTYASEIVAMRWDEPSPDPAAYRLHNAYFDAGDAEYLYQFLRYMKPKRMLEIGSGHSTRVAHLAFERNFAETGERTQHRCIEPYECDRLEGLNGFELIRQPLEQCDLDWSTELGAGDVLFIDSSHMIRPQGDVLMEYLEILPQLASGVYVHIHDIHTPRDYPDRMVLEDVLFWNEQYLLEALLSGNERYEVIGSLNYLRHHHYDELAAVCPLLNHQTEPNSFYLRVR